MARQDQYVCTFGLDGTSIGVWDSWSGGEIDSEETKHRAGGMSPQRSYGGPVTVGNITASRVFHPERDSDLIHRLISRVGRGRITGTRQKLDADGNAVGRPLNYSGTLKRVSPGDVDSDGSDMDMYEIEVSTEGSVA